MADCFCVENYFNYFTEIEEHFQRRRGTILLLSTLDWALIETWKDAGIPLEAALRGIDAAFARWERRPSKTRKVNSLAYCAQEILAAAEEMKEAEVGTARAEKPEAGFAPAEVAAYLERNAAAIEASTAGLPASSQALARETARSLGALARSCVPRVSEPHTGAAIPLEDFERRLTVLEEKLFASLLAATPDEQLVAVRAEADRELAPYRRNMSAPQIEQLLKQYVHKRLLEKFGLPRLSLFYMQ
ncbi:MAG TPA: hypothetical protein VFI82_01715 [Terriglobales bacterium]|nr:hypothetical protein [Terriglobales bacterium]